MYVYTYVYMYVCMYVNEGSLSFDPNNAKFTQNVHEGTGRVNNYVRPKSVQNWLKNEFFTKELVYFKLWMACFSWNGTRLFRNFFYFQLLKFLSLWGSLFLYLLPIVVCIYVCLFVCLFACLFVCLFVC